MDERFDLLIVGAGPAGLAACRAAAGHGLRVALIDERRTLGGSVSGELGASAADPSSCWLTPCVGASDADRATLAPYLGDHGAAHVELDAIAWGLFPGWTLAVATQGATRRFDADQIVLATGRYVERPVFPGHQLDGVVTPLGLLHAIEHGHARRGDRVVLLGDGPVADAMVAAAEAAGLELVAQLSDAEGASSAAPGGRDDTLDRLTLSDAPRAAGARRLERIDAPLHDGVRRLSAEWCCVCGPDAAATELAGMAGIPLRFVGYGTGFRPERGLDGRTSAPGCFVAGGMAASAALDATLRDGHVVGTAAALRASRASAADLEAALGSDAYTPAPPPAPGRVPLLLRDLPGDDVVACHCTGHTVGDVLDAIAAGARSLDDVKRQSKVGMGPCQGRDCHRLVARALDLVGEVDVATLHAMRHRAPIRPLPAKLLVEREVRS